MRKFAQSLGPLNPFGAVRITLPPEYSFIDDPRTHSLNLKNAKKLYRNLGTAIRQHEREQKKFVRNLIRSSPFKQILKGGIFPPRSEIRGVK